MKTLIYLKIYQILHIINIMLSKEEYKKKQIQQYYKNKYKQKQTFNNYLDKEMKI